MTPLESTIGLHVQLPTMFSDWTLHDEQDVEDVIEVMKSYIKSIIDYTKSSIK